jgi:hypothetical protein
MGRYYPVVENGKVVNYYGEHVSRTIAATGAWAASATLADIVLDRDLLITNITLQANMTVTLAATGLIDAPKRAIQGLSIVGDGKNLLSLTGSVAGGQLGKILAFINQLDNQGAALDANTDVGRTALSQFYQFHPGNYPKDKFDLSGVIPGPALSNLVARIICPAAAVMDSAANITAGTYTIEIDGVQGVPITKNMLVPYSYVQNFTHSALIGAFGQIFDVPTGHYVRRLVIMTDDNTAVAALRSDAQVTGVKVNIAKDSKDILAKNWTALKYATALRYGVVGDQQPTVLGAIATTRPGYNGGMHMPLGIAVVDFRDYFDPVRGLNLKNAQQGDVKIGMTIAVATGNTYLYWDCLDEPEAAWIGKK